MDIKILYLGGENFASFMQNQTRDGNTHSSMRKDLHRRLSSVIGCESLRDAYVAPDDLDICWFSRLLTRISSEDDLPEEFRSVIRERRKEYMRSLLDGSDGTECFEAGFAEIRAFLQVRNAACTRESPEGTARSADAISSRVSFDDLVSTAIEKASICGRIEHVKLREFRPIKDDSMEARQCKQGSDAVLDWMEDELHLEDSITVTAPRMRTRMRTLTVEGILDLSDRELTDEDWGNLQGASKPIDYTALSGLRLYNNQVSDSVVTDLIGSASEKGKLATIDVGCCRKLSVLTVVFIAERLRTLRLQSLKTLSVSGIQLSGTDLAQLTNNLNASTTPLLESLDLSHTHLGMWDDLGCESLAFTLVQNRRLRKLNISHNYLRSKHLRLIGEGLADMDAIAELDVSHNSSHDDGVAGSLPAIASLCSLLGSVASLNRINFSATGITDEAAFVLADSLSVHPNIAAIDLSENPRIGIFGIRSLFRMVLFRTGVLEVLDLRGFENQSIHSLYNFSDPSNDYHLSMSNLFHKAIARQCLRTWETAHQHFDDAFKEMRLDGAQYKPEKDDENVWQLPQTGVLTFTALFHRRGGVCDWNAASDERVSQAILNRFNHGVYSRVSSVDQKMKLIDAIAQFQCFDCDPTRLIQSPLNSHRLKLLMLETFLPRVRDPCLLIWNCRNVVDKLTPPFRCNTTRECGENAGESLTWFNATNPTGHYELHLGRMSDRIVATEALRMERQFVEMHKKSRLVKCLLNCKLNGEAFEFFSDFQLPSVGVWEFDFVNPNRFSDEQVPHAIKKERWTELSDILRSTFDNQVGGGERFAVDALRALSTTFYISCDQLIELLHRFDGHKGFQMNLIPLLYSRIVDYPEMRELLCRPRLGLPAVLTASDVEELERKLGQLALQNPMKFENTALVCDLTKFDGRGLAHVILKLLSSEKGSRLVNSKIGERIDSLQAAEPPKTWYQALPHAGVWACTYVVDEKSINKSLRKELAINICGFDARSFHE